MVKKHVEETIDRLPPHSVEAEEAVIGCLLNDPLTAYPIAKEQIGTSFEAFYDMRCRLVYQAVAETFNDSDSCPGTDLVLVQGWLKSRNHLENIGGMGYLAGLMQSTGLASQLEICIAEVLKLFRRRELIQLCSQSVDRLYDASDDFERVLSLAKREVMRISDVATVKEDRLYRISELLEYDTKHDPNALIGKNRWLCVGGELLIAANSGAGKSSAVMQMAILWALGIPFCGVGTVRPLKSVVFGDENDKGDLAEMAQGVLGHLANCGFNQDEDFEYEDKRRLLDENLIFVDCQALCGDAFLMFAERKIKELKPDIAWLDPLVSFADVDLTKQEGAAKFLRKGLGGITKKTNVLWAVVHHTIKPPKDGKKSGWKQSDYQYASAGSYDIPGWARATMTLQEAEDGVYRMIFAKRGARAGATHPDGTPTKVVWVRHGKDGIYWEQVPPPEEPEPSENDQHGGKNHGQGGKPSVIKEVAASNLYDFLRACKDEGEGLNEVSKRLENYLAKRSQDVSLRTCQRIIPLLVSNGKLVKNADSKYSKGPNA